MLKKLILIVGLPGSGKSTVAEFIKKKFDADLFCTGDIIRDEIKRRKLKCTAENEVLIADWFFQNKQKEKTIIKRIYGKIKKSNKEIIVLEGLTTYKYLKYLEKISKIRPIVIHVKAPLKLRVEREFKRGRFGKKENLEYIKSRDKFEENRGIGKLIRSANYIIDNSKLDKKQLNKKTHEIMKKILTK